MSFYLYLPYVAVGFVSGIFFLGMAYVCKHTHFLDNRRLLPFIVRMEGMCAAYPLSVLGDFIKPPGLPNDLEHVLPLFIAMFVAGILTVLILPRLLTWSWWESDE
jgi:hypothetical protein